MKKLRGMFIVASAMAVICVVFGTALVANHYLSVQENKNATCHSTHATHVVAIRNNRIYPVHTDALLCDKLTIVNEDAITRLIAFGVHTHHQAYDGFTEGFVKKGQSVTVTLNKAGSFRFHDHLDDEVEGYFTVTK